MTSFNVQFKNKIQWLFLVPLLISKYFPGWKPLRYILCILFHEYGKLFLKHEWQLSSYNECGGKTLRHCSSYSWLSTWLHLKWTTIQNWWAHLWSRSWDWKTKVSDLDLGMEILKHSGHENLSPGKVVQAFNPRRLRQGDLWVQRSALDKASSKSMHGGTHLQSGPQKLQPLLVNW